MCESVGVCCNEETEEYIICVALCGWWCVGCRHMNMWMVKCAVMQVHVERYEGCCNVWERKRIAVSISVGLYNNCKPIGSQPSTGYYCDSQESSRLLCCSCRHLNLLVCGVKKTAESGWWKKWILLAVQKGLSDVVFVTPIGICFLGCVLCSKDELLRTGITAAPQLSICHGQSDPSKCFRKQIYRTRSLDIRSRLIILIWGSKRSRKTAVWGVWSWLAGSLGKESTKFWYRNVFSTVNCVQWWFPLCHLSC